MNREKGNSTPARLASTTDRTRELEPPKEAEDANGNQKKRSKKSKTSTFTRKNKTMVDINRRATKKSTQEESMQYTGIKWCRYRRAESRPGLEEVSR